MKKINICISNLLALLLTLTSCTSDSLTVEKVYCNYMTETVGVESPVTISWKMSSSERGQFQSAFRIIITDRPDLQENIKLNTWDSGKTASDVSTGIECNITDLEPGKKYYYFVKVWDRQGKESDWSKAGTFITSLFTASDWDNASWIGYEQFPEEKEIVPGIPRYGSKKNSRNNLKNPVVPYFRKDFTPSKKISSAMMFVSGMGQYRAWLNGKEVSDNFLTPGWTDYKKTCLYNTYDVTTLVNDGNNTIGMLAGTGFGFQNWERYAKLIIAYGYPMVKAKLLIRYSDGSSESIVTDNSWKTSPSPLVFSTMYGGETWDARLEQAGWNTPGFQDSAWIPALEIISPGGEMIPETGYPVKVRQVFNPVKIHKTDDKEYTVDFGQNASGIIEMTVKGKKGDVIRITPAELINDDFSPNQRATGSPYYYEYILKGGENETWKPSFTYYGFRYARVSGARIGNNPEDEDETRLVEINMLHTANSTPDHGSFICSNPLFNKIDTLIRWGMISNMQSYMTDCPHREKLGWLEQSYLLGGSLTFTFDMHLLYRHLVKLMMDAQMSDGLVPNIAPEYLNFGDVFSDSPEWGSAIVMLPWLLYKIYNDQESMYTAWESMNRYVNYLDSKRVNGLLSYGLGDWYDLGPELPGFPQLSPYEATATATMYLDCKRLSEMAGLMDKKKDSIRLAVLAEELRENYNKALFDPETGIYSSASQTSMAIPLSMGMTERKYHDLVLKNLVDSIQAHGNAITAGDIGFHYLVDALTAGNQSQLIYDMNNRDDVPGYGYQLKMGATALTESWDALPIKSNNHMMLGHMKEWLYAGLGGIRQTESSSGFHEVIIKPAFPGGLASTDVSYESVYGRIRSQWKNNDEALEMTVEIPVNCTGLIVLPSTDPGLITENNIPIASSKFLEIKARDNVSTTVEAGSGVYHFRIEK